jgi:diguanylate cyclase (GGDEF)-like protein
MQDENILLADDDPQMLEMLAEFLREQGYQVQAVADGSQAMAALDTQEFHLALLDLMLPGHSGLELLSYLKAHTPDTEVILFTGHAGVDSAIQALRLGAYDYLLKSDLRLDNLKAVVIRALEHRNLELNNRQLLLNLRLAQEELAKRRAAELSQVRRIGEALAVPLTWEQLFHGLLNLIWESMSLEILGIEFQGSQKELSLEAYRRQAWVSDATFGTFKDWLKKHFEVMTSGAPLCVIDAASPQKVPWPAVLCEKALAAEELAMIAAGRGTAFSPEETELFRIFVLQGEAALKNLVLFEEVKGLAVRDGLTGLYNYRHFWELMLNEVEQSRRYQQPLSLLFLDVDNFKAINDTLGHTQGDAVLKVLARCLEGAVRQADMVCRYGGEEFVVLCPQTSLEQAKTLGERLRRQISQLQAAVPDKELRLSVSIGVAGLKPGMDGATLLSSADTALYRAKQNGKNRVCGME